MGYQTLTFPPDMDVETRETFMGLNFDPYTLDDTVAALLDLADRELPLTYLVTPNVDHMVRLDAEPDLLPLYQNAGMTVCDSKVLSLLSRFEGKNLPTAPGSDVVSALIRNYISPTEKIVLIGGDAETIEALARDYGLTNIAWHNPPMGLRNNPDAVKKAAEFVCLHNERFAFLCVGSPQQEMIALEAMKMSTGKGIALCCGASIDFLTGKEKRAPLWMRNAGLEWLHRLMSQPGRLWRRYLVDGPRVFRIWMKSRKP